MHELQAVSRSNLGPLKEQLVLLTPKPSVLGADQRLRMVPLILWAPHSSSEVPFPVCSDVTGFRAGLLKRFSFFLLCLLPPSSCHAVQVFLFNKIVPESPFESASKSYSS